MSSYFAPCSCVLSQVQIPPAVKDCEECLQIASAVVACQDSVGPCSKNGQINLGAINDVTACNNGSQCPVTYTILDYDTISFSSVTVDPSTGVVDFTTADTAVANTFGWIHYRVDCACVAYLSGQGRIQVCIKDLCFGVDCPQGQECDPCDGTCVDEQPDVEIE